MNQFVQDKGTPVLSADERAKVRFAFFKRAGQVNLTDNITTHHQYLCASLFEEVTETI